MRDQYRVAGEFLDHLAQRFLNGDRSKLVMIPGNHDVCWNTSFSAMQRVPDSELPNDIHYALLEPDSDYRWSWKDRALFKIHDKDLYRQRLRWYWELAQNFYAGVPLLTPIDPSRGFQLFELFDRRIIVAAFDSITGNDCFGYSGAISRGAVARASLALRDIDHTYDLQVAVWHHSIQGPPIREDYMDVSQVHEMAGLNFQLGLHGHQHVAETATHYIHLDETQAMAVTSAGSLCAGSRELPRGVNRQYNIIVLNDSFERARIHVRELVEGEQFTRKHGRGFTQGFVDVAWRSLTDISGRAIKADDENLRRATLRAEEALKHGQLTLAVEQLVSVRPSPNSYGRKLLVAALQKLDEPQLILSAIGEAHSIEEAVLRIVALLRSDRLSDAEELLEQWTGIDAATRQQIQDQIMIKRAMRIP